jgi:protein CrcB
MTTILYAALGGAIGASLRYGVNVTAPKLLGLDFPWATMIVNVVGSFVMGALIAAMAAGWNTSQEMRVFLATGILGGFTTFSAFSLDFASLWERKEQGLAIAYASGSVVLSLVAVFAGLWLARHGAAMSGVQQIHVKRTEEGMRLDRWFKVHFPTLGHGKLSKLLRTGQVRVDGARVKSNARLESGQMIRVPPLNLDDKPETGGEDAKPKPLSAADKAYFQSLILFEDKHLYVLNKPAGLAVQGGSRTTRHVDGLLMGLAAEMYDRPRLVHRLDRDTSGILVIAKTRQMATALGKLFQTRSVRKIYWALVNGVPKPEQGKIDKPLIKGGGAGEERMHEAHNPHDDGRSARLRTMPSSTRPRRRWPGSA